MARGSPSYSYTSHLQFHTSRHNKLSQNVQAAVERVITVDSFINFH
jgi:hypothetical protein